MLMPKTNNTSSVNESDEVGIDDRSPPMQQAEHLILNIKDKESHLIQ
jgi:hypothetical protein